MDLVTHFNGQIVNDNGILRVQNMLTMAEFNEIERIRNSQFFLIHNDGGDMGEPAPCGRSKSDFDRGHTHAYFTMMCREMPFRGLESGLRVWLRAASERSYRKSRLLDLWSAGIADYAEKNPMTGSNLKPIGENALAWYSILAGIPEPISRDRAIMLAERINDQRPEVPFVL